MQIFKFIVKPRAAVYSLIALYLSRCRVAGGLHLTQPVGCTNTAPLNFEVKASPVYVDGNPRDKVQVIIEKRLIEAGTIANPSVSKVVIALKGNGENFTSPGYSSLNGLDGIKYELVTNNNQSVAGIPINEGQGMKFTEIRARIIGGITLDLDEM